MEVISKSNESLKAILLPRNHDTLTDRQGGLSDKAKPYSQRTENLNMITNYLTHLRAPHA